MLRDLVQEVLGIRVAVVAVIVGGIIAGVVTSPVLAAASVSAFLIAETAHMFIYTGLRRRGLVRASIASSIVGLLLDSVIFVWLAFGQPEYILGQSLGKAWMVLVTLPVLVVLRNNLANASSSPRSRL